MDLSTYFSKPCALVHASSSDAAVDIAVFSSIVDSIPKLPPPGGDAFQETAEVEHS